MQVLVQAGRAQELAVDLLALPLTRLERERPRLPARGAELDASLGGRLAALLATGDFKGERGESLLFYPEAGKGPRRLLLVGLGAAEEVDAEALRAAAGIAVSQARTRRAERVACLLPALRRPDAESAARAAAEGALLGAYRFERYRTGERPPRAPERVILLTERAASLRAARAGARLGTILAESQNLARELSNEPPNALPPAGLAQAAARLAREVGLRCRVFDVAALRRLRAGGILAVGGGSANPPRLVVLEHGRPARGGRRRPTVCVVGKGITFDSGGLSIKPAASMVTMKHDMSGAAAVLGILRAAALLRLPLHLVGVIGAAENLPSGTAYRPDDIVTSLSGKTIEIGNTDAEGRIVLGDALAYAAREFRPRAIIDLATLTGACSVALGKWCSGVLGTSPRLVEALRQAGEATHERVWPLPLWREHREFMKSEIADVKQTAGRDGGTITAAAFLSHFVGDTPWAHLDIAPTASTERAGPYQPAGATGVGVRLVVECLRRARELRAFDGPE
jgi:leucyl aminopeptidase